MNNFPDFSAYGYQIKQELAANRAGGRVTYLAIAQETGQPVVLKQFQFARAHDGWKAYDTHMQEIHILKELNHPGVPCYLDSFETQDGFCMVQEYKNARSLASSRDFSLVEIRKIAVAVLEILIYLQKRNPSVIHRDIKPENILIDDQLNVYLVDFGFARMGQGEVGVSSVVKGTLGFMPPEQLFNRQLSAASDLYSLGITLICLLTKTASNDIGNLVDISYQVKFKHLVPKISLHWVTWLEKMVDPRIQGRFATAEIALAALPSCEICLPEVVLSRSILELSATRVGEIISHGITLNNSVPETVLEGYWEIEPHPSDPFPNSGISAWIAVEPSNFQANHVECQITIDTRKLMLDKRYERRLLLHTNAASKTYVVPLRVRTAPIPIAKQQSPYKFMLFLLLASWALSSVLIGCIAVIGSTTSTPMMTTIGASAGVAVGFEIAAWTMTSSLYSTGAMTSALSGITLGIVTLFLGLTRTWFEHGAGIAMLLPAIAGTVGGWVLGVATGIVVETLVERGAHKLFAIALSLTTVLLGATLGYGITIGWLHPLLWLLTAGEGLLLATLLLRLPLLQKKQIAQYRKFERHLIKP